MASNKQILIKLASYRSFVVVSFILFHLMLTMAKFYSSDSFLKLKRNSQIYCHIKASLWHLNEWRIENKAEHCQIENLNRLNVTGFGTSHHVMQWFIERKEREERKQLFLSRNFSQRSVWVFDEKRKSSCKYMCAHSQRNFWWNEEEAPLFYECGQCLFIYL